MLPQIPRPTSKYIPDNIYKILAALGLFLRIINPKILITMGGPIIIITINNIKPPKSIFPSNAIIF